MGVITHVYAPKIRTVCTTALKNIPDTLGLYPSLPGILDRRSQLFRAFLRFPTTAGQFPSEAVKICPKYLKDVTVSSGMPQAWKSLAALSLISSAAIRRLFHSTPLEH